MTCPQNLSPQNLSTMLKDKEIVLIDIREPGEYNQSHLRAALSMPQSQLTQQSLATLAHKGHPVVLYCQTGQRSQKIFRKYDLANKPNFYTLRGGLDACSHIGLSMTTHANCSLPIMQQVNIVVGTFVVCGTGLGVFLSPYWLLLPTIIGLGLVNAGMTGWCGMAKIISLLPWNNRSKCK